jgi:hypothetical protein
MSDFSFQHRSVEDWAIIADNCELFLPRQDDYNPKCNAFMVWMGHEEAWPSTCKMEDMHKRWMEVMDKMGRVPGWMPRKEIGRYPSIKDGRISIFIDNSSKTRSIHLWMSIIEAKEFGESIIEAADTCEHIKDKRKETEEQCG